MKKKIMTAVSRIFMVLAVLFTMGFGFNYTPATASGDSSVCITTFADSVSIVAHAEDPKPSSGKQGDDTSNWKDIIGFFVTWVGRIGGVVAFVGAVMFGLAIKNNDAEQKQSGLLTLVAGVVVAGVATMADKFNFV